MGGLASVPFAQAEMNRLRDELPANMRAALQRSVETGNLTDPEYTVAVETFYHKHLCRLTPWPADVLTTLDYIARRPVYAIMNGPNEFTITGTIRDVDLTPRLGALRMPTLVTGGRFDEVTPSVAQQIHRAIPGSRMVMFENSSHLPFWEERERFFDVLSRFLLATES